MHRALLWLVLLVAARPKTTLVVASFMALVCVGLAIQRLSISTDQNKQFSERVGFFRDYLDFIDQFPENEAVYVVVETTGTPPPLRRWTALADEIAARLRSIPSFVRLVEVRVPSEGMGVQGLAFDSSARVRAAAQEVVRFVPLAKLWGEAPVGVAAAMGDTPIERFLGALNLSKPDSDTARFVGLLAESWNRALSSRDSRLTPGHGLPDLAALDAADPSRLGYFYVPDHSDPSRSILLVRVYPQRDFTSMTALSDAADAIRREVSAANASFPEFRTGITGRPALEADELRTTDKDARLAEILALTTVFIGLVVLLRSAWLALVVEIGLGFGIAWTFGWATMTVGELNLLSQVFLLALIAIGVDYLIQVASRYRHEAARHRSPKVLWVRVFGQIAAPINTTCAGAAGAFLVSALTDFKGAADLGVIAGGGLFLCLLSGYTVVPALLTLRPVVRKNAPAAAGLPLAHRAGAWALVGPIAWLVLLAGVTPYILRNRFDPGLISLQAPNLESVKLVRRLETWFSVVMTSDLDLLRRCREAVATSPHVDRTESVLDAADNRRWLVEEWKALPPVAWSPPTDVRTSALPSLSRRAQTLAGRLQEVSPESAQSLRAFAATLSGEDSSAKSGLSDRLSEWQRGFVDQLKESLAQFAPPPIDAAALPTELRSHLVGRDGRYALYIYPNADLWEQQNLAAFVRDVDARVNAVPGAPRPTGIAQNIYHTTAAIQRAFYQATGMALGLIIILVVFDFRKLVPTLLAFSVLALGLPMLLALMGLLGVSWNFANFFGLPILLGAGHEYGVFLVHRYLEAKRDPRRTWRAWDVSDRALLMCAIATCGSFGFFWAVGHHEGLRSLGLVMALGVASIYLAAVIVLRPLLLMSLARHRRPAREESRA